MAGSKERLLAGYSEHSIGTLSSMQSQVLKAGWHRCLIALVFWLYAGLGGVTALCPAASAQDGPPVEDGSEPWQIKADRIEYDQAQDEYVATGKVSIVRQERTLTADNVRLNQKTGEALADGHVQLISNSDILSGSRLELNLNDETGVLTDGTVFISKNHLYLSGRKIRKTGLQTYAAQDISITSCPGPDPDWKLTGKDFKVTIEGYGSATHTALWAGKIPLLYSPYLLFPVKLQRQSGLLMPEFGYSDRKGSQYLQPVYWAINESSDATFYSHYMSERGWRNGIEYRYVLDENSKGAVFAEGFEDRKIDDGQDDNSRRWGYEGDSVLRENDDRYWFRMKHDQNLGEDWTAKLDLDIVSDQDYLHEFKSGYGGFNQTREYFQETFGRDLDDYNDPIRVNRLNLNRTWTQYSFNGDLRWNDNVIKRRQAVEDDTLQELPSLSLDGARQPLGNTAFYCGLDSSYTHFYRIKGTRGQRVDIYPRVYYPFNLFQALSVEPSVGVRQTAWHIDAYESEPDHGRYDLYRAIYDFQLDTSTEFYRIYDTPLSGIDRVKHSIVPEVLYQYTPEEDQSDYPEFDTIDRIERKNLITYGVTNTLTARSSGQSGNNTGQFQYIEFLRFKLTQSFDIDKHNEGDPEPFSYIEAELDLTPGRYVSLDSDAQWSVYDNEFESLNTALSVWNSRGDRLTADYRYTRENSDKSQVGVQTLRLDGELQVTEKWRLRAAYEYNYFDDLEIEKLIGVSYQAFCWGVTADFSVQEDNQEFAVKFNLVGLEAIGQ